MVFARVEHKRCVLISKLSSNQISRDRQSSTSNLISKDGLGRCRLLFPINLRNFRFHRRSTCQKRIHISAERYARTCIAETCLDCQNGYKKCSRLHNYIHINRHYPSLAQRLPQVHTYKQFTRYISLHTI